MAYTRNKFLLKVIDELTKDGEMAIQNAYYGKSFRNRTYNLHDSYASAVYVNGVLYRYTIRYVGAELSKEDRPTGLTYKGERSFPNRRGERLLQGDEITMNGRDEANRFFADYKPKERGIQLVIIAAMFYGSILERRKYHVISSATSFMQELEKKYNSPAYRLKIWRNLDKYGSGSFDVQGKTKI